MYLGVDIQLLVLHEELLVLFAAVIIVVVIILLVIGPSVVLRAYSQVCTQGIPGALGGLMGYQGSNPDWRHARQAAYSFIISPDLIL